MASPSTTITSTSTSPTVDSPYTVTVDVAAIMGALMWPVAVIILVVILRKRLPDMTQALTRRITKVGVAGVTLELAEAKPFIPKWTDSFTAFDLRRQATAADINDSTAANFISQLEDVDNVDYAIIALGDGEQWLTSRLYIMAIVLGRMKNLKALVFTGLRKRFIGWAEPEKVRWALAQKYPQLEEAYSEAYANVFEIYGSPKIIITTESGRLGTAGAPNNSQPGIDLIQDFLQKIQSPPIVLPLPNELDKNWILIDESTNTYEYANWLTPNKLEAVLDEALCVNSIIAETFYALTPELQIHRILSIPHRWLAITTDDGKFQGLSDRNLLLKEISKQLSNS